MATKVTIPLNVINAFVDTINQNNSNTDNEPLMYGTVINDDGTLKVVIDGAENPTPVQMTANFAAGDRVLVSIVNREAMVVGNILHPIDAREVSKNTSDIGKNTSDIEQNASDILDRVEIDKVIDTINSSEEKTEAGAFKVIKADKLELLGLVKFTDLSEAGSTEINGSNIKTGTIDADKVTVTGTLKTGNINANAIDIYAKTPNSNAWVHMYTNDLHDEDDKIIDKEIYIDAIGDYESNLGLSGSLGFYATVRPKGSTHPDMSMALGKRSFVIDAGNDTSIHVFKDYIYITSKDTDVTIRDGTVFVGGRIACGRIDGATNIYWGGGDDYIEKGYGQGRLLSTKSSNNESFVRIGYYDGSTDKGRINFYDDRVVYPSKNVFSGGIYSDADVLPVGTVKEATCASVSVPNSSSTAVASITLDKGTWIITGKVVFTQNANGLRMMNINSSSGYSGAYADIRPAVSGAQTSLGTVSIVQPTADTTYYLNARQTSGGALNTANISGTTNNGLRAVKIL